MEYIKTWIMVLVITALVAVVLGPWCLIAGVFFVAPFTDNTLVMEVVGIAIMLLVVIPAGFSMSDDMGIDLSVLWH